MRKSDQDALLILFGVALLSEAITSAVKAAEAANSALQDAGAGLYDLLHNDEAHMQDLPGKGLTRQAVLTIATNAGFPDPKLATAIAFAESGGLPGAIARTSREYSVGLWQINTKVHPYTVADMKDPIKNAAAAFKISRGGTNWNPWGAYTNGSYKKFQTGILA